MRLPAASRGPGIAPLAIPTARTRPLGEPDGVRGSTGVHRHACLAGGHEWRHDDRLCVEPYDRHCGECQ